MPSLVEALQIILGKVTPLGVERVDLQHALGRVLAKDVTATRDMPHYDNSARDGFALRSACRLRTMLRANAVAMLPQEPSVVAAGEEVDVHLLRGDVAMLEELEGIESCDMKISLAE